MPGKSNCSFCSNCNKETTYSVREEAKTRYMKRKEFTYTTIKAYCTECGREISMPDLRHKDLELFDAYYRKLEGLITLPEIRKLMSLYHIGKAPLSLALGFGEVTIARYFEGQMPSKRCSEIIRRALHDPKYMREMLEANRQRVGEPAYRKCIGALDELIKKQKASPKIQAAISYLLGELTEITPLALQKLLYFAQGLYMASYGKPLFSDDCEAWVHGPVYPDVYQQYKKYGYNPIEEETICFCDGSLDLSLQEQDILDLVIKSFGIYSGKTLECITHNENPWRTARGGATTIEYSKNIITKQSIESYFKEMKSRYGLSNKKEVLTYIRRMLRDNQ